MILKRGATRPTLHDELAAQAFVPEAPPPHSAPGWLHAQARRLTDWFRRATGAPEPSPRRQPRWATAPEPVKPTGTQTDAHDIPLTMRESIRRHVEAHPGIGFSDLCTALRAVPQTVAYHVRALERENAILGVKVAGRRRLYPKRHHAGRNPLPDGLEAPVRQRIMQLIEAGTDSPALLAGEMQISKRTVQRHLKELRAAGLVEGTRRPRLSARAAEALAALRDGTSSTA